MSYQFLDAYGSVLTADSSIVTGVTQRPVINIASILTPLNITIAGNPSISGTVNAVQQGAWTTSVVGGVSILGGNVGVNQLGAWTTSVVGGVSILGGTVGATQVGIWATSMVGGPINVNSILGTYPQDNTYARTNAGVFTLGVRNDNVSSFASANSNFTPFGVDSAGRSLVKPFAAEETRIEGYNSVVSTSVTTLVAAPGTGLKNYITDIMVANSGATTTLITFKSGSGSILGYTIAPTGGGSNIIGMAMPMKTGDNSTFDFQPTSASSILYVTVKGYKAP